MNRGKVAQKSKEAHVLSAEIQLLIDSQRHKFNWFLRWLIVFWTILILIGIFGIYKQNEIASQNKAHIDCIVKLFAHPRTGATTIDNSNGTCSIKGTP